MKKGLLEKEGTHTFYGSGSATSSDPKNPSTDYQSFKSSDEKKFSLGDFFGNFWQSIKQKISGEKKQDGSYQSFTNYSSPPK